MRCPVAQAAKPAIQRTVPNPDPNSHAELALFSKGAAELRPDPPVWDYWIRKDLPGPICGSYLECGYVHAHATPK